jgi:hypothetical protein
LVADRRGGVDLRVDVAMLFHVDICHASHGTTLHIAHQQVSTPWADKNTSTSFSQLQLHFCNHNFIFAIATSFFAIPTSFLQLQLHFLQLQTDNCESCRNSGQ